MVSAYPNQRACTRCEVIKPLSEFRRKANGKYGRQSECKPCGNARLDVWRAKTRDRRLAYNRAYYASERGRQVINEYQARKPGKKFAQVQVNLAIERGELVRPECCEACNRQRRVEGHHDDYAKPLVVRWLCRGCHKFWHRIHGEAANADALPRWNGIRTARIAAKIARLPTVLAMHAAGKQQKEIAARFGVSQATICHDLRTASQYAPG